jgi:hypothetical protein
MTDVISYQEAEKRVKLKPRSLLLGNGFSADYCSYKNLLEHSGLAADAPCRKVFDRLGTVNFEHVVRALEDAASVEIAYGHEVQAKVLMADAKAVRKALVHAVRETHPKHRDELLQVIPSCIEFLAPFEKIFTLNYDLLLYWVIVNTRQFGDGFYTAKDADGFRGPFKDEPRCNVFNVHGGLHLFLKEDGELEKRLAGSDGGIDAIVQTITEGNRFPIYVAEGTSAAKHRYIRSVAYLNHCYQKLKASSGQFIIYGHSADESDAHIYTALFTSKIDHLYFCIFDQTMLSELDGRLSHYQKANRSNVAYTFVDSKSVGVWD